MNNVDIFSATSEKKMPAWVKFTNPGDSIQGTYVGKIVGSIDGFGNEQVIYQVLKNGEVFNVGFGINKKVIIEEMNRTNFGQIIGFKYKGTIKIKNKLGKEVEVKDFGLFSDPKIVDTEWLKKNERNMPFQTTLSNELTKEQIVVNQEFSNFGVSESSPVPSSDAPSSVTPQDKLAVITKLAYDKIGVTDPNVMKDKVMEVTGIAFVELNYDKIISALNTIGA